MHRLGNRKDLKTQGSNCSFCYGELPCVHTHIFLDYNLTIYHLFLIKKNTKRNRVKVAVEIVQKVQS